MTQSTPHGYPYPIGTDRVMDGDDVMHAMATAVDTQLGAAASGQINIPITAAGTPASASVTFPVGRFIAPAGVTMSGNVSALVTTPDNMRVSVGSINATSMVIFGFRQSGTAAFPVCWQAAQQ